MTITADFWHLVGLLLAFLGVCGTGLAVMYRLTMKHLDSRMDTLEAVNRDETLHSQRIEREFLKFQAEMPLKYVMRDDYIRGQTVIEAKLDALATKVENAQLRGALGVPNRER